MRAAGHLGDQIKPERAGRQRAAITERRLQLDRRGDRRRRDDRQAGPLRPVQAGLGQRLADREVGVGDVPGPAADRNVIADGYPDGPGERRVPVTGQLPGEGPAGQQPGQVCLRVGAGRGYGTDAGNGDPGPHDRRPGVARVAEIIGIIIGSPRLTREHILAPNVIPGESGADCLSAGPHANSRPCNRRWTNSQRCQATSVTSIYTALSWLNKGSGGESTNPSEVVLAFSPDNYKQPFSVLDRDSSPAISLAQDERDPKEFGVTFHQVTGRGK